MDGIRVLLAAAACVAVLSGCGRKHPGSEADAATPATETTAGPDSTAEQQTPFDPMATREMGMGLTPARGPAEAYPPGSVAVDFEPAVMDFGVLPPGATARGTTRLWNVGSEDLTVYRSITSCGCTASEDLAGRIIRSGGYIDFDTTMTMKSGLGPKKEKITVFFEPDGKRAAIHYYVAEVSLPIRMTPAVVAASAWIDEEKRWEQTRQGEVTLTALDGHPFTIVRAQGLPPDYVDFDPAVDTPRAEYTIRWDLDKFEGVIPWFWVIETDRPDCPIIDARIQHSSTLPPRQPGKPWVSKAQRLLVGIVRRGEPFEVSASIEYAKNVPPDAEGAQVVSESTDLKVELLETQVDEQLLTYRMRLTVPDTTPPGLLYGSLAVSAGGFTSPLYIIGRVAE